MSQHDMDVANGPGLTFRADMNAALQALASQSSGASAPSPAFPCQIWADTGTGRLKQRNSANSAWLDMGPLDSALRDAANAGAYAADTGAANAYVCNFTPAITARSEGTPIRFKAANTNTGTCTINDGVGVVALVGGAQASLQGGEIVAGGIAWIQWSTSVGGGSYILLFCTGASEQTADATKGRHAVNADQVQKGVFGAAAAGGTVDAITASYTPAITSLANGMALYVRASGANTITTPSFTPNSGTIATKTIVKGNNLPLVAGDIVSTWIELQYDSTLDKWVLLNPATGISTPSAILADSVQVGRSGTASNNFHWRNLLDGLLRLSRGNAGAPVTDVMTVNADNSVSFPSGISGGFAKEYVSAEQTITLGAVTSLTHGLGAKPKLVTLSLIFKTADLGYAVDDEIDVRLDANNNSAGASVGRNATTLRLIVGASGMYAHNASGAVVFITPANCRLIVRAWL